jgi:hypothetical protein
VAAYIGPFTVVLAVAQEIADTYGGPWQWGNLWSMATHIVSIATAIRRAASDREMLPCLIASIVTFLVFSVASGLAQWYVATLHLSPATSAGLAALAFRVAMPVAIDLASMLYLSMRNGLPHDQALQRFRLKVTMRAANTRNNSFSSGKRNLPSTRGLTLPSAWRWRDSPSVGCSSSWLSRSPPSRGACLTQGG